MESRRKHSAAKRLLGLLLALIMVVGLLPATVSAATDATGAPVHSKIVNDNRDGTYTIELSVTGDADLPTQTQNTVNVLLVYDISQSMSNSAGSGRSTRGDEAENIIHGFLNTLLNKQANSNGTIIVNVALATFALDASGVVGWAPLS